MLTAIALGVLVGAVLGFTGAGGGILAVPALVVSFGWSIQQATPVALFAVAGSAAIGAAHGNCRKMIQYQAAVLIAGAGILTTSIGARAAQVMPQSLLLIAFAVVMMIVAVRLHRQLPAITDKGRVRIDDSHFQFALSGPAIAMLLITGCVSGFLTGLLGVGGGFVIVPMLRRYTALPMQGIVATSLMVIAFIGFGGIVSSVLQGVTLPASATLLFTIATAGGVLIGRHFAGQLPGCYIQRSFSCLLACVAAGMIVKAALD